MTITFVKSIKKHASIFFCLLLTAFNMQAQVAQGVLKKYPAHIIGRLQNVVERVKLPVSQQVELAAYFQRLDAEAMLKLQQGAGPEEIASYYTTISSHLSKILSPLQLNDYNTWTVTNSTSEIAKALKYRQELALNPSQLKTLLTIHLKTVPVNVEDILKVKRLEIGEIKKVLNASQIEKYFLAANRDSAMKTTGEYWRQLKKYNLVRPQDSLKICEELGRYTANQFAGISKVVYDRPEGSDSVNRYYTLNRPYLLWKLDVYTNTLPWWVWSQVGRIIIEREKLHITDDQIDSLLINNIRLEKKKWSKQLRYSNEFINVWPEQVSSMMRILTDEQYTRYLELKNYNHSLYNADRDWLSLKKAGLITQQADSAKVMNDNQAYELRWLVADEKVANSRTQRNLFSRQSIENRKPDLLKRLDSIGTDTADNKRTKTAYAW